MLARMKTFLSFPKKCTVYLGGSKNKSSTRLWTINLPGQSCLNFSRFTMPLLHPVQGSGSHSWMLNHFLQALLSVIYCRLLPGSRAGTRPPLVQVNPAGTVCCAECLQVAAAQGLCCQPPRALVESKPQEQTSSQIQRQEGNKRRAGKGDNLAWICSSVLYLLSPRL